jgi:glycosyltransferase involved in cell wall biosynthesis
VAYLGQRALLAYYGDLARFEEENVRSFDRVLANSLYSRESILRAHGVDARVCYLGVDSRRFAPRDGSRDGSAIGVGSFHPHKRVDLVIRALGRVRGERPPLTWIGNASAPGVVDELRTLAAEVGVRFTPRENVPDEELVGLLSRASLMVYAPRLEPFGYAPLEANGCGLPVIGVAEGGVRETVVDGENGLLVEPDEEAMARAVERLRDDAGLAARLGARGRELVLSRWSIESARDRLERHLREVAGAARA